MKLGGSIYHMAKRWLVCAGGGGGGGGGGGKDGNSNQG